MSGFSLGTDPTTCTLILDHMARDAEKEGHHGVAGRLSHVARCIKKWNTDKTQSGRTDTMRETVTTAYDLPGLVEDFKRLNEGATMNVEDTIAERAETHGDYKTQALTAQGLKSLMRKAPNWDNMPPALMESLDLIATKISRILHGDPETVEHWLDGEGYFRLGRRVVEND